MEQRIIGEYIARKRKEQNLTQGQLAEKLGVSNKTVSKWENGNSMPDYSIIRELCNTLDISLMELFDGRDSEHKENTSYTDEQVLELLERTQSLEKRVDKLFGIFEYDWIKIGLRILLYFCIFASIDMGLNYMYSLMPQDGIGNISMIDGFFGNDKGWSQSSYFDAFQNTIWLTFAVFILNKGFDHWVKSKTK